MEQIWIQFKGVKNVSEMQTGNASPLAPECPLTSYYVTVICKMGMIPRISLPAQDFVKTA